MNNKKRSLMQELKEGNRNLKAKLREANIEITRVRDIAAGDKRRMRVAAAELQKSAALLYAGIALNFGTNNGDGSITLRVKRVPTEYADRWQADVSLDEEANELVIRLVPQE